ncbi:hypothetical protein Glove_18g27 [Diversispora epigaea]|uniref:Uncharacterized protein n=1 Tax=Diversispora epigaea TaxID=1348612 RepID=A0A397JQN8_9GLOM|nr:hypothetical protein Glove_18g27 [Diversispora epigaea]
MEESSPDSASTLITIKNVRQELNRLSLLDSGITDDEFGNLLACITDNPNKVPDIEESLKYGNDNVKITYLRKLLESNVATKTPQNTEVKKKIINVFPGGLPYVKPEPLLYNSGANWEYQPDPSLKQILRSELKNHYENFILRHFDKANLPLYLFLSEAGTRKSRNTNEFHQTAIIISRNEANRQYQNSTDFRLIAKQNQPKFGH